MIKSVGKYKIYIPNNCLKKTKSMTLKEQIKYIKDLKKQVVETAHDGGSYKVWVGEGDIQALKEVYESLNRLKDLEK